MKAPTREDVLEYALEGLSVLRGTQSGNPDAKEDLEIWEHHQHCVRRQLELHRRKLIAKEQKK